ncbi:MAG: hypothetical protein K2X66_06390 [Cyanobacteria bacterium]|nr:hypothetical protein [Cyanobacteriota bacterium]
MKTPSEMKLSPMTFLTKLTLLCVLSAMTATFPVYAQLVSIDCGSGVGQAVSVNFSATHTGGNFDFSPNINPSCTVDSQTPGGATISWQDNGSSNTTGSMLLSRTMGTVSTLTATFTFNGSSFSQSVSTGIHSYTLTPHLNSVPDSKPDGSYQGSAILTATSL